MTDAPVSAPEVTVSSDAGEDDALAAAPLHAVPLPNASVDGIGGLLDILIPLGGRDDIPALASRLHLSADELLPLLEAGVLLGLVTVADADVHLTDAGQELAAASILKAKKLFSNAAVERAPLVRSIHRSLVSAQNQQLGEDFFLRQLQPSFTEAQARQQLDTAIDWGRYAELFDYDADRGQLTLDPAAGGEQDPSMPQTDGVSRESS